MSYRCAYAAALLDSPLPWTKMRAVYRLLGLGRGRLRAGVECEAVDVGLDRSHG